MEEDIGMRQDAQDILDLLIRHEVAIQQLYETFAAVFSDRHDFWMNLARDEQKHAQRLGMLRSAAAMETWLLQGSQLKPQALKTSIGYVESQTRRAHDGTFSSLEALSIAKDLESALLEQQFSKLRALPSPEIKTILMELAAETERHRKVIAETFALEKQ